MSALRRKLREGDLARHKLVATNLRLVVSVAKKYNRSGVDLSDLITVSFSSHCLWGLQARYDYPNFKQYISRILNPSHLS